MSSIGMNEELRNICNELSAIGNISSLAADVTCPGAVTGITIANEVNQSPCRPATDGMYSVNSAKT